MFEFKEPWSVGKMTVEEFLIGMCSLGTPKEIQMVGAFAEDPNDPTIRTAHRDTDLPLHRDGIYTQAIADMQGGRYVEKPNVDIIGMYCVRYDKPCFTTISKGGQDIDFEVDLKAGEALIMDNSLWHGRHGAVGNRLLIRFWITKK